MHIGLIGGIGPSATVAFYLQLVDRFKALSKPLDLTIVNAHMPVLATNAAENKKDDQARVFAGHIDQLKNGGCDIAMITSLAGHFCFAETEALASLPLLNGLEVIDRYCEERGIKRIGLLGSPSVLKTRFYGALSSCEAIIPEASDVDIGEAYMAMAAAGHCTDEQRQLFFDAGKAMIESGGADAVLLAGTDLGLAYYGQDPGYRVVDALEVHVDALVSLASA